MLPYRLLACVAVNDDVAHLNFHWLVAVRYVVDRTAAAHIFQCAGHYSLVYPTWQLAHGLRQLAHSIHHRSEVFPHLLSQNRLTLFQFGKDFIVFQRTLFAGDAALVVDLMNL